MKKFLRRSGAALLAACTVWTLIVTVESRSGFSTVRRENGLRLVTVSGELSEEDPARATEVGRVMEAEHDIRDLKNRRDAQ